MSTDPLIEEFRAKVACEAALPPQLRAGNYEVMQRIVDRHDGKLVAPVRLVEGAA